MTRPLTRRDLLQRAAAGGSLLTVPGLLAACGGGDGIEGAAQQTTTAAGEAKLANSLTISNWPLYIDIDEETKKRPTIQQFQDEYGVAVRYIEDINDNNEFFAKIQPALSQGQSVDRDLIVLTDWMAARLIRLGWVQKLDERALENKDNLVESLRDPKFDPGRQYTLPWQSGLTGIAYNPDLTGGPVTSIEQLLTDPKLKGKVTALSEMPDTIGLVMLSQGNDPSAVTDESFQGAIDALQEAVDSGQLRQFTGNEYGGPLSNGDLAACIAWSGDVVQLQLDNPKLEFTLPESGGMIWTDNMMIPNGGDAYTASTFMDFVYRPEVAAQIEAYVNYICPVEGAKEAIREIDAELADNPLIFPTEEILAETHIFDAEAADNEDYRTKFQALLGA